MHCVELVHGLGEHLDSLFHVMTAVEDGLFYFLLCQFPVYVKGDFCFLYVGTKEAFQSFQTYGRVGHHVIVDHRIITEQAGKSISGLVL